MKKNVKLKKWWAKALWFWLMFFFSGSRVDILEILSWKIHCFSPFSLKIIKNGKLSPKNCNFWLIFSKFLKTSPASDPPVRQPPYKPSPCGPLPPKRFLRALLNYLVSFFSWPLSFWHFSSLRFTYFRPAIIFEVQWFRGIRN